MSLLGGVCKVFVQEVVGRLEEGKDGKTARHLSIAFVGALEKRAL